MKIKGKKERSPQGVELFWHHTLSVCLQAIGWAIRREIFLQASGRYFHSIREDKHFKDDNDWAEVVSETL